VAAADAKAIVRGSSVTLQVLANDSDPDGDQLTLMAVQSPQHGTATRSGSSIIYRPAPGFVGVDQFTYTISDGRGGSASGLVQVSVLASQEECDRENRAHENHGRARESDAGGHDRGDEHDRRDEHGRDGDRDHDDHGREGSGRRDR
jgi:hypothetical protein